MFAWSEGFEAGLSVWSCLPIVLRGRSRLPALIGGGRGSYDRDGRRRDCSRDGFEEIVLGQIGVWSGPTEIIANQTDHDGEEKECFH